MRQVYAMLQMNALLIAKIYISTVNKSIEKLFPFVINRSCRDYFVVCELSSYSLKIPLNTLKADFLLNKFFYKQQLVFLSINNSN